MMENRPEIIVRFPPSPTGFLQMGNVRTLIYNYLFARQNGGKILLRIEDTDKERSRSEYEQAIYKDIEWLGLDYDNKDDVWKSSDRTEKYQEAISFLIKNNFAYISKEEEGENREVVRFRNPGGKIKFMDLIRGKIEIDISDLGNFIIARNINDPLYHLAVCVDDTASGITHIIRGDDHISNTPRQILIIEALGGKIPTYAHLPMVLAEDKSKLSKRKHGESVSLNYYINKGYEKEAILNFLTLIGWNPGTDQELFTKEELIKIFDISKIQKKGGVFDVKKLNWINREYITKQSKETQIKKIKEEISKTKFKNHPNINEDFLNKLLELFLERIHRWSEVGEEIINGEYEYLFEAPQNIDIQKLRWKNQNIVEVKEKIKKIIDIFDSEKDFESAIKNLAEKEGRGEIFWPLRYSLSGKDKSPDPFTIIKIIGPKETLKRLENILMDLEKYE